MFCGRLSLRTFLRLCGALTAFVCAGAYLVVPVESASAAVPLAQYVSTQKTYDGVPNNYAINLVEGSGVENVQAAARIAQEQGGGVLTQYPQFASLTVQAAKAGYAQKLAQALASAGIRVHSIAPTHDIAVEDSEIVVPNAKKGSFVPVDGTLRISGPVWNNALKLVNGDEAQKVDVPLEQVNVAVLDSGIAGLHPKLRGKIDYSRSVDCTGNGKPAALKEGQNDTMGHGTHVAGIIASDQQKLVHYGAGCEDGELCPYSPVDSHVFGGIAPKNVTLVDIKLYNEERDDYPEDLACAYTWVAEHDIDITNASLGDYWDPNSPHDAARVELVRRAVAYATEQGVLHVAGSGNDGINLDSPTTLDYFDANEGKWKCNIDMRNKKIYPAMFPDVVTVSAIDTNYNRAIFAEYPAEDTYCGNARASASNWGKNSIDVTAPGIEISSTFPTNNKGFEEYAAMGGTSAATPHATGVLALLKGIHPNYTAQQLRELLYKQAEQTPLNPPSDGKEYRGHGLVNALLAVTKDQPKPKVTVEYSDDSGKTWKALQGASVDGKIDIRVRATGPVTRLVVTGAGTGTAKGDGSFSGSAEVRFSQTITKKTPASQLSVKAVAYGRNNDSRADDDVSVTVTYSSPSVVCSPGESRVMYRLYNRVSQEHLYTADAHERDVLSKGDWTYEGVAWVSPVESETPVYRLYNPILGDHHYTTDTHERDVLVAYHNWVFEGVGWYSDDCKNVPVYRQFTELLRVGSHNYTADKHEYDTLNATGVWKAEGEAWYAIKWR